jgi:hypothetical protein
MYFDGTTLIGTVTVEKVLVVLPNGPKSCDALLRTLTSAIVAGQQHWFCFATLDHVQVTSVRQQHW